MFALEGGMRSREGSIVKEENATKTGENIENPMHSAELEKAPIESEIQKEEESKLGDKGNEDYTKELNQFQEKEIESPKDIEGVFSS